MTKVVAPISAPMSLDQAGRVADRFVTKCRKDGGTLQHDIVQEVLEQEGDALADDMFNALRTRVERRAEMIVRHFRLDPTKTQAEMITALGRKKEYVNAEVLETMPMDGPDEGDLYFFPAKRNIPAAELAAEFESRDLVPHYRAQMQVNADDKVFADEHPNGMQWEVGGHYNSASFGRWSGEREVRVDRLDGGWGDDTWFAGVRKVSPQV